MFLSSSAYAQNTEHNGLGGFINSQNLISDVSAVGIHSTAFFWANASWNAGSDVNIQLNGNVNNRDLSYISADYTATGWDGIAFHAPCFGGACNFYTACAAILNTFYSAAYPENQLIATATHEIGHCLGADHIWDTSEVMNNTPGSSFAAHNCLLGDGNCGVTPLAAAFINTLY